MPVCQYCKKEFKKITTLQVHTCVKKQRYEQKDHYGVRLGFNTCLAWYKKHAANAKMNTYDDFVASSYYSAFVKFGNFMESIHCISPSHFIDWIICQDKIKLDQWCKDSVYDKWLQEFLKTESMDSALGRSFMTADKWGESNEARFNDYFRYNSPNKICSDIVSGRVSAWMVYQCETGIEFLSGLDEVQERFILPYIDPEAWQSRFSRCSFDVKSAKDMLSESGF